MFCISNVQEVVKFAIVKMENPVNTSRYHSNEQIKMTLTIKKH